MSDRVSLPIFEIDADDRRYGQRLQQLLRHLRKSPRSRDDLWQFVAYAMNMARLSRAQLFQDVWALWMSGRKREGFFVEFGAADGVYLSNTYMLEKTMGWRGVLAEPNPRFHQSLADNRGCAVSRKCVYGRSGETVSLLLAEVGELSRIAGVHADDATADGKRRVSEVVEVETISLNDLLIQHEAPKEIDFMSIDTEGSELDILEAFDWDRWDVRSIVLEQNHGPTRDRLRALLPAHGYRQMWPALSLWDGWYVRD